MKEDDTITKKVGTENPFRVPNNYFENLTGEILSRLPEKEKVALASPESTTWQKMRPWLYMAAMFIGAAMIIRVASSDGSSVETPVDRMASEETEMEMEYINNVIDNSMLEDYSLYVYLADTNVE